MKRIVIVAIATLLMGCPSHHSEQTIDVVAIQKNSTELLLQSSFDLNDLPDSIGFLEPNSVRVTEKGIFIELERLFTEESGIFIAREGVTVNTESGINPSFKKLSENVYSYVIKG